MSRIGSWRRARTCEDEGPEGNHMLALRAKPFASVEYRSNPERSGINLKVILKSHPQYPFTEPQEKQTQFPNQQSNLIHSLTSLINLHLCSRWRVPSLQPARALPVASRGGCITEPRYLLRGAISISAPLLLLVCQVSCLIQSNRAAVGSGFG